MGSKKEKFCDYFENFLCRLFGEEVSSDFAENVCKDKKRNKGCIEARKLFIKGKTNAGAIVPPIEAINAFQKAAMRFFSLGDYRYAVEARIMAGELFLKRGDFKSTRKEFLLSKNLFDEGSQKKAISLIQREELSRRIKEIEKSITPKEVSRVEELKEEIEKTRLDFDKSGQEAERKKSVEIVQAEISELVSKHGDISKSLVSPNSEKEKEKESEKNENNEA